MFRVLGVAVLTAWLLAVVDIVLVRFGVSERKADAEESYGRAQKLYLAGQYSRAVDLYRQARNEQRNNGTYRIALIQALQGSNRPDEAEAEARQFVVQRPTDGPANLMMARLLATEKRYEEAAWFYHRALYANWPGSSQRTPVRMELADMLAGQGRTEEVVAEVLLLLNEAGTNVDIRRRSADLLLKSGAWRRAAEVYSELVRELTDDATLRADFGLALFGDKEYRRARGELAMAVRLGASGEDVRRKLEIAQSVVELDPNLRSVGYQERERRKGALLREVVQIAAACGLDVSSPALAAAQVLLSKRHKAKTDAEDELDAAEAVWGAMPSNCKSSPKGEAVSILFTGSVTVNSPHK